MQTDTVPGANIDRAFNWTFKCCNKSRRDVFGM